jgi:ADP-ribose pyrophosphatase
MEHRPWKTLRRQLLLDRSPWLRVVADDIELPDGRFVEGYLRLETHDHVVEVPRTSDGRLLLLRSYKRGPDAVDLQPPAGMIEADEAPAEAAARELLEETGYEAAEWTFLARCVLGGNLGAGWAHLFLATGCRNVSTPASGDLEAAEIVLLTLDETRRRWRNGEFLQLGSVAAIGMALDHLQPSAPHGPSAT